MQLTFVQKTEGELFARSTEEQTQYIFSEKKIRELIEKAGFSRVESYGFLSDTSPNKNEERIHFVAYKGEQND